jgi:hypothetical protein
MKKKEAQEFCRKWLPAWTGNQPETLIEFYSDNAVYVDPANKDGLRGRDQILQYFKKLLATNPDWRWEALEIYPTDLGFIGKWKATMPVGSETIVENGMDIVEIKTSRITRNEVYFDRSRLIEAKRKLKTTK